VPGDRSQHRIPGPTSALGRRRAGLPGFWIVSPRTAVGRRRDVTERSSRRHTASTTSCYRHRRVR
jgi:hypothetical protein